MCVRNCINYDIISVDIHSFIHSLYYNIRQNTGEITMEGWLV